jgi:hypothetical protein
MADEPQTREGAPVNARAFAAKTESPPTSPNFALIHGKKRETWTIVFGVSGILVSAYAVFMGFSGVIMIIGFRGVNPGMSGTSGPSPESMKAYMAAAGWDYCVSGLLAGFLFAGAIGILMRRRWSVRLLVTWSLLKIVAAIAFGVLISQGFSQMMQAATTQSKGAAPMPTGMMSTMSLIMAVIWSVMTCILPVACLIWFAIGSVREQVRAWK